MKKYVPTIFTILRIVVTPFIVAAVFFQAWWWVLGLFSFGIVTDFLDGYLARAYDASSRFGTYLDPVADKIFFTTSFAAIAFLSPLPLVSSWFVYLLIFREACLMILGGLVLFFDPEMGGDAHVLLKPSVWGKLSTLFLSIYFLLLCTWALAVWFTCRCAAYLDVMAGLAFPVVVLTTILSLITYFVRALLFYGKRTQ